MAKLIVNPTSSSRREILLGRVLLSIGRDPSNDLVLPDAMVSRRHAVIECRGNQYFLRDCNSSNGSVVNGDRVSERSLRDGDLVALGTVRLLFREELELEDAGAKVVQHPSSPRLQCPSCQADHRKGDLFCRECGTRLAAPSGPPKVVCASCGSAVLLPAKFCNACGALLSADGQRLEAMQPQAIPEEVANDSSQGTGPSQLTPDVSAPPAEVLGPDVPASGGQAERSVESLKGTRGTPPPVPSSNGSLAEAPRMEVPRAPAPSAPLRPRPAVRPVPTPPPEALGGRSEPRPPVGLPSRLAAGLVDGGIVAVAQTVVIAPVAYYWWSRDLPRTPADVPFLPILLSVVVVLLALLLGAGYYAYFWGIKGSTPGQRLLDLAVEDERGVSPIGIPRALLRLFGYVLSAALLGIGFLMIAFGGYGLHDRIAGTRVRRQRRE